MCARRTHSLQSSVSTTQSVELTHSRQILHETPGTWEVAQAAIILWWLNVKNDNRKHRSGDAKTAINVVHNLTCSYGQLAFCENLRVITSTVRGFSQLPPRGWKRRVTGICICIYLVCAGTPFGLLNAINKAFYTCAADVCWCAHVFIGILPT